MNNNIIALRRILKEAYIKHSKDDWFMTKSADGYVEIVYSYNNDYWEDELWEQEPTCTVKVYSYAFGPSRMHEFNGPNLERASEKALKEVIEWLKNYKTFNKNE